MGQPQQHSSGWLEDILQAFGLLLGGIAITLWRYRTEVLLALPIIALAFFLRDVPFGLQLFAGSLVVLIGWLARGPLDGVLHRADVRRRWTRACQRSGFVPPRIMLIRWDKTGRFPVPWPAIQRIPAGDRLRVRITAKSPFKSLHNLQDVIASEYGRDVEVRPVAHPKSAWATVYLMRQDPFLGAPALSWPNKDAERLSVWDPIPFAVDEEDRVQYVEPMLGHVLIGGLTRSGKTTGVGMLLSTSALDPDEQMIVFDNKEALAPWLPCAREFVGANMGHAVRVLEQVQKQMQARWFELKREGRTEAGPGDPTTAIVIDELSYYMTHENKKQREAFRRLFLDILQRGLGAGFHYVAAMQRPAANIIDSNAREQFGYRIAFRTKSVHTTEMIFGTREEANDCPAHMIPEDKTFRGVCYLGTDSLRGRRAKAFMLTREDITAIVARASGQSMERELALETALSGPLAADYGTDALQSGRTSASSRAQEPDLEAMWEMPSVPRETSDGPPNELPNAPNSSKRLEFDGSPAENGKTLPRDRDKDIEHARVLLGAHPEGLRREEIYTGDGTHPGVPFQSTIPPMLRTGEVIKEGRGVKGSPFRYRLAGPTDREAEPEP